MRAGAVAVLVAASGLGIAGAAAAFDVTAELARPTVEDSPSPPLPAKVRTPTVVPGTVFAWAPCPEDAVRRGKACVRPAGESPPAGQDPGADPGDDD